MSRCHYRASSMLYDWWDTGGCSSITNSSLHIEGPIWSQRFRTFFVSPKSFIPGLCCRVLVHIGLLEPFDIVLLPQQWFLDRNSTTWASFTESSPNRRFWRIFSRHFFNFAVMQGDWWNFPLIFLLLLIYQSLFWSCFVPFPDVS